MTTLFALEPEPRILPVSTAARAAYLDQLRAELDRCLDALATTGDEELPALREEFEDAWTTLERELGRGERPTVH